MLMLKQFRLDGR